MSATVGTTDAVREAGDPVDEVRILLVDDRPENLLALSSLLEGPDRVLVQARSGRDALRTLLRQDFAVILLDVSMPDMDGFETAALIRQRPASAHTPIIFVTAHGDEGHVLRAYSLGAVDYITAPVDPEVVKAKVAVFADLFRKTAENRRQAERLRHAEQLLRQQAEQKLRETHARLQQIIDSVADYAIFSLDVDGNVATWNAGAERLFLYKEADVVGRPVGMLLAVDEQGRRDRAGQQCGRAVVEGRGEIDTWFQRKDGTRFYGTGVVTAMRDAKGNLVGFSKVTRDITERRIADEALRQKAEELAEANRLKDEFLAVLSHELRTPLNAIIGWAQILIDRRADAAMLARGLDAIARNGKAQLDLVNDILDVSRFITGKFRMEVAPVDLRTIAEAAIETGQTAAHAKGIKLDLRLPAAPVTVNGDAMRLQQVFWNLVSNALKFTPEGGSVRLEIASDARAVTATLRDNGIGIAADFLPYVFDRFRQADSSTSRSAGGLGLGLAIVKHIVELHGGTVQADSPGRGRGATFTVSLPLAAGSTVHAHPAGTHVPVAPDTWGPPSGGFQIRLEPDPTAGAGATPDGANGSTATSASGSIGGGAAPGAAPAGQAVRPLSCVRCLVVDDHADTLDVLRTALEQRGAQVLLAASASEALAVIGEADVLVADLAMPGEDGFALIGRVRALPAAQGGAIPAIAVTAHAGEADRVRSLRAGFQEHLSKPVNAEHLANAIERVLTDAVVSRP